MAKRTLPQTSRRTTTVDREIAARIRERRIMLGLTQQQLAELIGVTYQQAHKYEVGSNRISVARLLDLCRVLGFNVADLLSEVVPGARIKRRPALERDQLAVAQDLGRLDGYTREALVRFVHALARRSPHALPGAML